MKECSFCYKNCLIDINKTGDCSIRKSINNNIKTINYGHLVAATIDVLEKKPFYHFYPDNHTLSIALFGCNYKCKFCQNYKFTQSNLGDSQLAESFLKGAFGKPINSDDLVSTLKEKDVSIVSYTYSEPTVWLDYMLDMARGVKKAGGYNLMVTNGSFSENVFESVVENIDGFNIDLKGSRKFYEDYCDADILPVLHNISKIADFQNKVLEVTTMIIEGVHTVDEIVELGKFLFDSGVKVWHITRFFPHYKMESFNTTSEKFLEKVLDEVKKIGIDFIYGGNTVNFKNSSTFCPSCGDYLIARSSYNGVKENKIEATHGVCPKCGRKIYGKF